jgi:hypothetical protein
MGSFTDNVAIVKSATAWKQLVQASDNVGAWVQTTSVLPITGVGCALKVATVTRNPDGSFDTDEVLSFMPGVAASSATPPVLSQIVGWQATAGITALSGTLAQALTTPLGATESYDVTVTGAALGDVVVASYSKDLGALVTLTSVVKAADTARVVVTNHGSTLSGTLAQALTTAAGATDSYDVTVTGAALGNFAKASYSIDLGAKVTLSAVVKATNTVRVTVVNGGAAPLSLSGTFTASVVAGSALALTAGNAGTFKCTVFKGAA